MKLKKNVNQVKHKKSMTLRSHARTVIKKPRKASRAVTRVTRTKLFKSGNSMAVRIPKEFHLQGNEVQIEKHGNELIIREIPQTLEAVLKLFSQFSKDMFSEKRVDTLPQARDYEWE